MEERTGVVTFAGKPVTLVGPQLRPGDVAPAFNALSIDLSPVTLADSRGTVRLVSVVPSVDTPICDSQTRRFNAEAAAIAGVTVLTVSNDLPFALKRWAAAAEVERVQLLSDHRDLAFGRAYGVLIKEMRLLTRAVFVVDRDDLIRHVEYVPEVKTHPAYDAALAAVREAAR